MAISTQHTALKALHSEAEAEAAPCFLRLPPPVAAAAATAAAVGECCIAEMARPSMRLVKKSWMTCRHGLGGRGDSSQMSNRMLHVYGAGDGSVTPRGGCVELACALHGPASV